MHKFTWALSLVGALLLSGSAMAAVHSFTTISLLGSNEAPAVSSDGSGVVNAIYNDASNTLYYTINYALDSSSTQLVGAHIHGAAAEGVNAGVQINLSPPTSLVADSFSGTASLNPSQEVDLLAGLYYINLHSDQHAGGELRGQLIESAATESFSDRPLDSSQVPEVVSGSPGAGTLNATYNSATNTLTFAMTWNSLTSSIVACHFHGPAAAGDTAGIQVFVSAMSGFDASATTGTFTGSTSVTETQEAQILSDQWYLNIHTILNGAAEVRAQLDGASTVPVEMSLFATE